MPEDFLFSGDDESNNPFILKLGTNCDSSFLDPHPQALLHSDIKLAKMFMRYRG